MPIKDRYMTNKGLKGSKNLKGTKILYLVTLYLLIEEETIGKKDLMRKLIFMSP